MFKIKSQIFMSMLLTFSAQAAIASTYDTQISQQLKIMAAHSSYGDSKTVDDAKVSAANDKIKELLLKWGSTAAVMADAFKQAQKAGLTVIDSPNHDIRVYSWDTESGGSMHFFQAVAQCRNGTKVTAQDLGPKDEGDPGMTYEQVSTFKNTKGETIALLAGTVIASHINYSSDIAAYLIKNGKLQPFKAFKTKTQSLDSIECQASIGGPGDDTRPTIIIHDASKTVKVPLIDEKTGFHKKYLLYKFDGDKFVFSGQGT